MFEQIWGSSESPWIFIEKIKRKIWEWRQSCDCGWHRRKLMVVLHPSLPESWYPAIAASPLSYRYPIIIGVGFSIPISNYRYDLGLGRRNVIVGILASENLVLLQKWIHQTFQKRVGLILIFRDQSLQECVYSLLHILSKKGMKGMKPSSSSGSHSSFIRSLASCLFSFSPRLVRRRKSSLPIMVLSSFLS